MTPVPMMFLNQSGEHASLNTPERLKAWENDVRERLGQISEDAPMSSSETCSAGATDDCG